MPPEFPSAHPPLHAADLGADPAAALEAWLELAREAGDEAANAMALATTSLAGAPSVRIVLLRTADRDGLVFHTHRLSRKGVEMEARPEVALALHWTRPIHRQVRVEGMRISSNVPPAGVSPHGRLRRARWCQVATSWNAAGRRRDAGSPTTPLSPGLGSGAAIGSFRSASSSGRAARTASTTGSGSAGTAAPG